MCWRLLRIVGVMAALYGGFFWGSFLIGADVVMEYSYDTLDRRLDQDD